MNLSRRRLLTAPALLLAPMDATTVLVQAPGGGDAVWLPSLRAHVVLAGHLAGMDLIAVTFGLGLGGGTLDLLALCGGAPFRLRGLEVFRWRGDDRSEIGTRLALSGDGGSVLLRRDVAWKLAPTNWARESWTDRLQWAGIGLLDQPVRPPTAGWHARLHQARVAMAALLSPAPAFVPDAALRLQAATLSLAVSAQPSMRHTPSGPFSIV